MDIVAVGAHPDDAEIAMAASLAGFVRQGYKTAIVDLTNGEPTPFGTPAKRAAEAAAAAKALGVRRVTLPLSNRYLYDTVEARQTLASALRSLRPWLLFLPYPQDAHPDHWQASALGLAGRFYSKLTKTDMPGEPWYPPKFMFHVVTHLGLAPQPPLVLDVSKDFDKKIKAIRCYQSQFYSGNRKGEVEERLEVRARSYGMLIGARYGEAFHSPEPFGFQNLDNLHLPGFGSLRERRGKKR